MGALGRPALGLSLLQAELTAAGVACDVRYLTFPFAELIGLEAYDWLSYEVPYTAFAGDWASPARSTAPTGSASRPTSTPCCATHGA
jgi:hypothetical protein